MTLPAPALRMVRGIPTTITLAALVSGLLAIYAAIRSLEPAAAATPLHLHSALLIMLAMILDGLDGNVARLLHAESELGGELDTFVDLTAFGIAPAMLLYAGFSGYPAWLRIAIGCLLVASGAYRLARFKVIDPHRGQHGYTGLPITVCAALVSAFFVLAVRAPAAWGPLKPGLAPGPVSASLLGLVLLLALLQVSRIHFAKPSKNPVFFGAAIVLVALLLFGSAPLSAGSALAMALYGLYYLAIAPFLNRGG